MKRKMRKKRFFEPEGETLIKNNLERISNNNKVCIKCSKFILIISIVSNLIIFILLLIEKKKRKSFEQKLFNESDLEEINLNFLKYGKIKKNNNYNINKPFLPSNPNDEFIQEYSKTYYNQSNSRYHLEEMFYNRNLFKIDYSYLPYLKISKSISYEENANKIFNLAGILNLTLLDFYYYGINNDITNFNHIHISMGFDANYILLSSVSIASLLNNSSPHTFIHLHIILNNCTYTDVKPIINLKKINKNIEFILYNGKQAEYDFTERAKSERRGIGDYARVLIPEIVNNTNRVIIIDSGDLLVNKDLSELYFFDIGDNYFVFSLDEYAGTSNNDIPIANNNFYPNTGVCLVNVRKFRKDNLYKSAFLASLAFNKLPCPYQDIFIMISNFKFKFWGLNYNCPDFFFNDPPTKDPNQIGAINSWDGHQKSPYKYSKKELFEAAINPVISHLYHKKPYKNEASAKMQEKWRQYVKLTGLYEQIKIKYPSAFNL